LKIPDKAGKLTFKALRMYSSGEVVRLIGDAGSDTPAPTAGAGRRARQRRRRGQRSGDRRLDRRRARIGHQGGGPLTARRSRVAA
jgi:hypothetical protein